MEELEAYAFSGNRDDVVRGMVSVNTDALYLVRPGQGERPALPGAKPTLPVPCPSCPGTPRRALSRPTSPLFALPSRSLFPVDARTAPF